MQRAVLDLMKCTDDHQQIPFEKLWGLFAGLCILWVVMIGFLLWHHVRCWGTEMRHSLAFRKLTACTGIRTQRGKLCMEVWMVSIEDTNGKWLIYRTEWKSWSRNRSLKREKPNQRIQEFLKCKTVLHLLTSYIWNHVLQNHGGTHTLQHLESKPFLLLKPRKWWHNICVQVQKQIQHVPCISCSFSLLKYI